MPQCEKCDSTSRTFDFPGGKGRRCKKHADPGMINVKNPRCEHINCTSTSVAFDFLGGKGRFCKEHALSNMANVRSIQCEATGCECRSRNFDIAGGKGRFCKSHATPEMIDVRNARCRYEGCEFRSNFSVKGKPPLYCARHKLDGMCSKGACEYEDCIIVAGFNYPTETRRRFCAIHKLDGMVNVSMKLCEHTGCRKHPSFGTEGQTAKFCKTHAPDGTNSKTKLCEHMGCTIHPSYSNPGNSPRFCMKHKEMGMTCVGKGCEFVGCECRSRYYDFPGGKGRFCTRHKEVGMVDVKNPKCSECDSLARYGIPGGIRTKCTIHRKPGMLGRPRARCVTCGKPALYGKNFTPNHCESHKDDDDENMLERQCVSCNLTMVLDKNNKCEFCDPQKFESTRLAKQNALMTYLNSRGLRGNSTDIVIDHGICGKERPDRVFEFADKIVILECDEHQHRDRQCACEQTRMVNIAQMYGGMPVYFIRWNPDNYASSSKSPDAIVKRHKLVASYIEDIYNNRVSVPNALLSVFYMYFDGWIDIAHASWEVITPFHSV